MQFNLAFLNNFISEVNVIYIDLSSIVDYSFGFFLCMEINLILECLSSQPITYYHFNSVSRIGLV